MTTLANKIQDVLNEPGCGINQGKSEKERKKGCTKPLQPGAAAGGCAFDGAKIALQPITDVAHLVHGPIACEGHSWDNRNSGSSGSKLYRTSFTTDMSEQDVIFGGEKRLWRSIREIIEKYNPPAVFVYQTCVPAMTGDHIEAVCKKASEKFGTPCIPVNVPGFVGAKTIGNKLAGEALLDYVIGTQEPEYTTPYDINIIGEYNVAGELWQVKPLLDELGIRILSCICGDAKYREVASSHRAKAAMMVCSRAMINVARKMEERYGIPYFEGSFYGISDMSDSLRNIARLLVERGAPDDLIARTEAVIEREEKRAWAGIAAYRERLQGKKVLAHHGRREILVGRGGAAGRRHGNRGHERQEIDEGRQGADQGDHGRGRAHDRRYEAARDVQGSERGARGHHAFRRAFAVHCAEGEDALDGHQPGAPLRLCGL